VIIRKYIIDRVILSNTKVLPGVRIAGFICLICFMTSNLLIRIGV